MKISDSGRERIQGYEGYHDPLPDGSCKAYQRVYHGKLDVPTIGWGCTEGVKMGMIWSRQQAEDAFSKELSKFEDAVTRLVTVPMTQNEFDALVSLAYNIGIGGKGKGEKPGFSTSSVLSRLNKGDRVGAAKAFHLWNKAGGGVVDGLVQRRASEASLFQKPVSAPSKPSMPQTVSESKEKPSCSKVAVLAGSAVAAVSQVASTDPVGTAEQALSTGNRVRSVARGSHELSMWAFSLADWPYLLGGAVAAGGLYWFLCHYLPSKQGTPS